MNTNNLLVPGKELDLTSPCNHVSLFPVWNSIDFSVSDFNRFIGQSSALFLNLFIYSWLSWVFVAVRGFSLVAASGGYSLLRCTGFSLWWLVFVVEHRLQVCGLQLLWDAGSVVVAHGLSCSAACGIFPDRGSNPCSLHWQVDS